MKLRQNLIYPIAVAVIAAIIIWYIQKPNIDIRYTLSEKIPISFAGSTQNEIVQQIIVQNSGDVEVKKIIIKINVPISDYEIRKYSASDITEVFTTSMGIEFIYPQLPPQGNFQIAFKSNGLGIEYSNLSIFHDNGKAKEALVQQNDSTFGSTSTFFLIIIYILMVFYSARNNIVITSRNNLMYKTIEKVINKDKPWYISEKNWPMIISEIIEYKISKDASYGTDINESNCYEILNVNKPDIFDVDTWDEIQRKTIPLFTNIYSIKITNSLFEEDILRLLSIKKPKFLPISDWENLLSKANKRYLELKKNNVYITLRDNNSVKNELRKKKPDEIHEDTWDLYRNYIQKTFLDNAQHQLFISNNKLALIKELKKIELDQENIRKFEDICKNAIRSVVNSELQILIRDILDRKSIGYDKPEYIEDIYWMNLQGLEKNVIKVDNQIIKYEILLDLTYSIIENAKLISDKPESLDYSEWNELQDLSRNMIDIRNKQERYTKYNNIIDIVLNKKDLPLNKPDAVIQEDWIILNRLYQSILDMEIIKDRENSLDELSNTMDATKIYLDVLKDKIKNQIEIINRLMIDPDYINRVESYDDTFAPGNWTILRNMALLLVSNKTQEKPEEDIG